MKYRADWLRFDFVAGLTATAVVGEIPCNLPAFVRPHTKLLVKLWPTVYEVVRNSGLGRKLGRERLFFNLEQAVDVYKERLG